MNSFSVFTGAVVLDPPSSIPGLHAHTCVFLPTTTPNKPLCGLVVLSLWDFVIHIV